MTIAHLYICIILCRKITMDKKDGEVDRVQKMAIDLNNEYPSECDSYESSDTN